MKVVPATRVPAENCIWAAAERAGHARSAALQAARPGGRRRVLQAAACPAANAHCRRSSPSSRGAALQGAVATRARLRVPVFPGLPA